MRIHELLTALCWFASFVGYMWFLCDRCKMPAAMAPLGTIALLTVAVYFAALVGILYPAALVLLLTGVVLFGWMIACRSRALFSFDLALFAAGCIALWARYHSALLVVNDDFSHWGMMARHLLTHDRLPKAADALIRFQSYPPATGCFLYYTCRFLGTGDGMLISMQAWVTLSGLMPLFAFAKGKGHIVKKTALAALVLIGLSMYHGTAALTVDNLVGVLAVGAMCMLYYAHTHPNSLPLAAAALALVSLVKDSGLFFVAMLVLLYAVAGLKQSGWRSSVKRLAVSGAPALAARLFWYIHIKLAFPAADVSRHALTLKNMRMMGSDKSYEDMFTIARKLLGEAFAFHNMAMEILLTLFVAGVLMAVLYRLIGGRWRIAAHMTVPAVALFVYIAWTVMMGLMYIFNMSVTNAMALVSYERYNGSCVLFLYGMLAVWLLHFSWEMPGWAPACLVLLLLMPYHFGGMWTLGIPRLFEENYFVPLRAKMEQLAVKRPLLSDEKAVVIVEAEEADSFAEYMARYAFQSNEIRVLDVTTASMAEAADVYYFACPSSTHAALRLTVAAEKVTLEDSAP